MQKKNPRVELCKLAEHFWHSVAKSNSNSQYQLSLPANYFQPQMLEAGYVAGNYISEYLWSLFRPSRIKSGRWQGPLHWQQVSFNITDMWYDEDNQQKVSRWKKHKKINDKRVALYVADLMISDQEKISKIVEIEYAKKIQEDWTGQWQTDINTTLVFERLPELTRLEVILPLQLGYFFVQMKKINDLLFPTWHPFLLAIIFKAQVQGHVQYWQLFQSELSVEQLAAAMDTDRIFPVELLQLILSFDECRDPELPMKRLLSIPEFRGCE